MTKQDAVVSVGTVAGEIRDAAEMRYDDPKDAELRSMLNGWADHLLAAWRALEGKDASQA